MPTSDGLTRLAGRAAQASAVVAALGIVSLVLLYVGLGVGSSSLLRSGPVNDVCVVAWYALLLPALPVVSGFLAPRVHFARHLATACGLVGIIGIILFQWLLLSGRWAFEDQVGYAGGSVLLIGAWIGIIGRLGRDHPVLSTSPFRLVLAALYVGYPPWAWRLGRGLLTGRTSIRGQ